MSSSSTSFDEHFLQILMRRLLESQSFLWSSSSSSPSSDQSRISRLVGLVDRTRVFTKVLRDSLLVMTPPATPKNDNSGNSSSSSNQIDEQWKQFLVALKKEKEEVSTTKKKSSKLKQNTSITHQEQLLNFAINNPFPIGSSVVAEQTSALSSDLKKVIHVVNNNDDDEYSLAMNNSPGRNKNKASSKTINKQKSSSSSTLLSAGKIAAPLSKFGKNIDLLKRISRNDKSIITKNNNDDNNQDQKVRILHVNAVFTPTELEKTSKKDKYNKHGKNDAEDDAEENTKKKTTNNKTNNSTKEDEEEICSSLVPVAGLRLTMDYSSGLFMTLRPSKKSNKDNVDVVGDDEDELKLDENENQVDLVGEVESGENGKVMLLYA